MALILHCADEDAIQVYNKFELLEVETSDSSGSLSSSVVQPKDDSDEILKKFYDYCNPLKNIVYERFTFWITRMADSFDNFLTELHTTVKTYDFIASYKMIRDKIVFSMADVRVQEDLLREPDLSLVKAINICGSVEVSQKQLEVMQPGTQAVNVITQKSRNQRRPEKHLTVNMPCRYCGGGGDSKQAKLKDLLQCLPKVVGTPAQLYDFRLLSLFFFRFSIRSSCLL